MNVTVSILKCLLFWISLIFRISSDIISAQVQKFENHRVLRLLRLPEQRQSHKRDTKDRYNAILAR